MSIKHEGSYSPAPGVTTKKRIASLAIAAATVAALATVALATGGSGVTGPVVARATFGDTVAIKIKLRDDPDVIQVSDAGETVMQHITLAPGGYTGWHSHPGPAIALVTSGELTLYSADDPSCAPHTVVAGKGFVDSGSDVHMARNETGVNTEVWVTYLNVPLTGTSAGVFRKDELNPGNCGFRGF